MSEFLSTNFGSLDWSIVAVYLVATAALGAYVNRYVSSVDDYMVGGRASGTALNTATYIGTGLGLVTLMYASIDGFGKGFAYMTLGLIGAAVSLLIGSTGFVVHRLRELNLTTIPEYFEQRFSRRTRVLAGGICALAGILNMGLFPKMGATFLAYATGLADGAGSAETTVNLITSALIVLVLVYTVMGGMVSVIITDYLQFVVLTIGLGLGLMFCMTHEELGWSRIVNTWAETRGEAAFNPLHPDSYGGMWVIWQACVMLTALIAWAPEASRALTAASPATARKTFLWASPNAFVRLAMPALWGIAAYAFFVSTVSGQQYFFPAGLDGPVDHAAHAMPLLLGKIVPTGLLGILVAGLLAAFMSTHDSYFLCWSSVLVRDVVNPLRKTPLDGQAQIRWTRLFVVAIGLFLLAWGVWYETPESVWNYMAVTGTIYLSGAGVALIGGVYWRRASTAGATAALLGGLISLTNLFVKPLHAWAETAWPRIAPLVTDAHLAVGNFAFCGALFVVFSLAMPDPPRGADPQPLSEGEAG